MADIDTHSRPVRGPAVVAGWDSAGARTGRAGSIPASRPGRGLARDKDRHLLPAWLRDGPAGDRRRLRRRRLVRPTAGLAAIPLGLALWSVMGAAVVAAAHPACRLA